MLVLVKDGVVQFVTVDACVLEVSWVFVEYQREVLEGVEQLPHNAAGIAQCPFE